jgi:hypothetical protein
MVISDQWVHLLRKAKDVERESPLKRRVTPGRVGMEIIDVFSRRSRKNFNG